MATFTNQATLSYNGNTTDSNIITGQILEVLSAAKTAVTGNYSSGDDVTYVISIVNSGNTAFTGLTVTDNLGAYDFNGTQLTPLTYKDGSIRYYINGELQTAPAAAAGPPLVISGITVPAGGNAVIIYEADANRYAPLAPTSEITNEAVVDGMGLTAPLTASETITSRENAVLTINKSLSPLTVTESGQLTYTFTIQNSGNAPAAVADNVVLTDTFDPVLDPISVTFNGTALTEGTDYTYDTATGQFSTVAGQITVPAATYTQDTATGVWKVTPGISTLVVTGRV